MDRQPFVDRLLETENLTDQLEDDDANSLIDWGIAKIDDLINGIDDEEQAGDKVGRLMHVMRGLNSLGGDPASVSHESILDLLGRYGLMLEQEMQADEDEGRSVAEQVATMQPGEAIQRVQEWLQTKSSHS